MTLYDQLIELKDDAYREFQARLVPNIPQETILGVRTPHPFLCDRDDPVL